LGLYARIAAKNGNFNAAEVALRDAMAIARNAPPTWLDSTVQAAADAASQLDSYDAAVAFVAKVTAGYEEALMAKEVTVHLSLPPPRKDHAANSEGDGS
jgi:hypothetical protein